MLASHRVGSLATHIHTCTAGGGREVRERRESCLLFVFLSLITGALLGTQWLCFLMKGMDV